MNQRAVLSGSAIFLVVLLILYESLPQWGPVLERLDRRLMPEKYEYESVDGTVMHIDINVTSNSWNGIVGLCRLTIRTASGQRTIAPYWRDCYTFSDGDSIHAYRRPKVALDSGWYFQAK